MRKPAHSKPKTTGVIRANAAKHTSLSVNRKPVNQEASRHQCLWRWVAEFGRIEIGYCHQTRSFVRVLDEGSLVWKGRSSYGSLEAALADAEAGISRCMKELGIKDID